MTLKPIIKCGVLDHLERISELVTVNMRLLHDSYGDLDLEVLFRSAPKIAATVSNSFEMLKNIHGTEAALNLKYFNGGNVSVEWAQDVFFAMVDQQVLCRDGSKCR